jgi:hypothetical protein
VQEEGFGYHQDSISELLMIKKELSVNLNSLCEKDNII